MTKTLLTVDDSASIRDMLNSVLVNAGYNVVQARDGLEGLACLKERSFDAIITDINMPRLDGFGFIERVREDADFRAIPILVLSTEEGDHNRKRARAAGATGWIAKPFNPDQLIGAVKRVTA